MRKRVLSLLLALTLCIGLSTPAFAVGETEITTDDGYTYKLSNPVLGTTTWTHKDDDYAYNGKILTETVYLISSNTVITLPVGLDPHYTGYYYLKNDGHSSGYTVGYAGDPIEFSADMGHENEQTGDWEIEWSTFDYPECTLRITGNASGRGGAICFRAVYGDAGNNTTNTPSTWATDYVNTAISNGLVPDALQSNYTQAATRAEFCALAVALYETATGKEIAGRSTFSDTTDVNVQKMASLGVVAGVGDNKFSPDTSLTREQAAAMLSRLANVMNKPMPEQTPTFTDNGRIGSWAYDAVGHVQAAGIMSGVGNNQFSPSTAYTREQSIVTMLRMFDYVK